MKTRPELIGDILKTLLSKTQQEEHKKAVVEKTWQEIAGSDLVKHTKPAALRAGVLSINVDSSAWLHHATMLKYDLLKEIKKRLGDKIKDIKFKAGPI